MPFSSHSLYQHLLAMTGAPCFWVAYSGGVDSHVLLHALASLRDRLRCATGAVHVNHGLHANALDWEIHCRTVCDALGMDFVSLRVDGRHSGGESPEAAARAARYSALRDWLPQGHCLLTAQHQDDQAETLLLQLLRGSGVKGLAAMPVLARFGGGHLLRPLLGCSRQSILAYAGENGLQWVDDPSNQDTSLDRNYLRHRVLPRLRERWPAASVTLARSAAHCAEAAAVMEELARQDVGILTGDAPHGRSGTTLRVSALRALTPDRQRNALRYWLLHNAERLPSAAILARILHDILGSRPDAEPCVRWGGFALRRYRDRLYLGPDIPDPVQGVWLAWRPGETMVLPEGGVLRAVGTTKGGIRADAIDQGQLRISYRQGGERCRPAGRRHHRALKKLFQDAGVPPWERQRIPLIYIDNELAAVAGYWICEPFHAVPGVAAYCIEWLRDATGGSDARSVKQLR